MRAPQATLLGLPASRQESQPLGADLLPPHPRDSESQPLEPASLGLPAPETGEGVLAPQANLLGLPAR